MASSCSSGTLGPVATAGALADAAGLEKALRQGGDTPVSLDGLIFTGADQITDFKNGDVAVGSTWPYQTLTLQAAKVPVKEVIPSVGATGWADTWMLAKKAPHPNCAYKWMQYISKPVPQAQQAIYFGETPANTKACPIMDQLDKGSCALFHANAPASYFDSIAFWKTPTTTCDDGTSSCIPYQDWQTAWTTEVTG